MTEDQKLDLILDTLGDLQELVYVLKLAAENYIDSDLSINHSLENLNAESDFTRVKKHIEDLEYLFMDVG